MMRFSYVKSYILACGTEAGKISIYDTNLSQKKHEFKAHAPHFCSAIAFSPLNNLLLSSAGMDGTIQFFDIMMGKNVKVIDTQNELTAMSFCPDGHTVAVGTTSGKILIYDLKDAKRVKLALKGQESKNSQGSYASSSRCVIV